MDEIVPFVTYLTESVNRRLLKLLSRVLELPDDYLWDKVQSHGPPVAEGYFRHTLYMPMKQETIEIGKGLRMHGCVTGLKHIKPESDILYRHCDFGTTTMLFSVPISSLQIWAPDQKWRYVKYNPGALVINIGETLECEYKCNFNVKGQTYIATHIVISGGHFRATRHRVVAPPEDQLGDERLSLVLFNSSIGDLRMEPAMGQCKVYFFVELLTTFVSMICFFKSPLLSKEKEWQTLKAHTENSVLYVQEASQSVFFYCIPTYLAKLLIIIVQVPTNKEWREAHIADSTHPTEEVQHEITYVNGVKMRKKLYHGVQVLLPYQNIVLLQFQFSFYV